MKSFTKTFDIDKAIGWELYKTSLAEELFDRTAADARCPQRVIASAYTGKVRVKGTLFIVTLTEGEA